MLNFNYICIKSKIGVDFRRYKLRRKDVLSFKDFYRQIEKLHHLQDIPFVLFYLDPEDFMLPINNDDNLTKAIGSAKHMYDDTSRINVNNNEHYLYNYDTHQALPVVRKMPFLKVSIEKEEIFLDYHNGTLNSKCRKNQPFKSISNLVLPSHDQNNQRPTIGMPADFRQVSSIIDVGIVPETCRRVRIVKHGSDRPLGFYIRDGTYRRMNSHGQLELVTGIFISRLVPGGLAESTGLLGVNAEVLEVNGVPVTYGKTLDQVTDMMVANSSNLIITIRPGRSNELS